MSYEGYTQVLCKNGHYDTYDCYAYAEYECGFEDSDVWHCPICGEYGEFYNSVDQTNCDDVGYIIMEDLLLKESKKEQCNLGHYHVVEAATYRIPTEQEKYALQTYIVDGKRVQLNNPSVLPYSKL